MTVRNVAKELGGHQCIRIQDGNRSWITIPLKYNGDIITCELREPTKEEQLALRVNWLTTPMEELTPQSIWQSKTVLERYQLQMPGKEYPAVPEEE